MHKLNNQQAPNNDCDVSRVCSLSPSLEGVGDGALPSSGSSYYIHRCLQKTRLLPCFWPGQGADNIWKLRSLCSGAAFLRQPQIGSDYTF
uniref:Uncharacterized protein n=1 Tax=Peromyscus maniculatus bairdii TaxID=230844 RepID=A0A8C8W4G2_PERMB